MKTHLLTLLLLCLCPLATASELALIKIHLPLYVPQALINENDPAHSEPTSITFVTRSAYPENPLHVLNEPFVPHHDATWHEKSNDTNLISLCGIKLTYGHAPKKPGENAGSLQITMDMKDYKKPKDIRMTDAQIKKLIQQAITKSLRNPVIVVKNEELE